MGKDIYNYIPFDGQQVNEGFFPAVQRYSKYFGLLLSQGNEAFLRRHLYALRNEVSKINSFRRQRSENKKPVKKIKAFSRKVTGLTLALGSAVPSYQVPRVKYSGCAFAEITERRVKYLRRLKKKTEKDTTVYNPVRACSVHKVENSKPVEIKKKYSFNLPGEIITEKHHYHNLKSCSSVWLCPICANRILKKREAVNFQVSEYLEKERGLSRYMLTLTVPHHAAQTYDEVIKNLHKSYERTKQSEEGKALDKVCNIVIRAFENRYGVNGLHPHFHIVFFTPDRSQIENEIENFRLKFCAFSGSNFEKGTDFRQLGNGEYIFESIKELTEPMKMGRNSVDALHLAFVDLSEFKKYAEAVRGHKRLQKSNEYKKIEKSLNIKEQTDAEICEASTDSEEFIFITDNAYNEIRTDYVIKADIISTLNEFKYAKSLIKILKTKDLRVRKKGGKWLIVRKTKRKANGFNEIAMNKKGNWIKNDYGKQKTVEFD